MKLPLSRWLLSVVLLLPLLAYMNAILWHFYVEGAFFWDSGNCAGTVWHRDLGLTTPPMLYEGANSSLYALHVIPLFSLLTGLSWIVPVDMATWYALILGIGHALPGVGVYWLVGSGFGAPTRRHALLGALFGLMFAFNGLALAIIRFPHPEILTAGGIILLCAALALNRPGLAAAFLAFSLATREDAGLHIFGLLAVLIVIDRWRGRPSALGRRYFVTALVALGYSVAVLILQKWIFGAELAARGIGSQLAHTYLGDPPFSGMSLDRVAARFFGLPLYRPYIFVPALVALVWAIRARNPLIMVGYIAFLPWLTLQLVAQTDIAGTLSGYYAFPFLIASVWPLAAVIIEAHRRQILPDGRATMLGFGAMLLTSFLGLSSQWDNGGPFNLWRGFTSPVSMGRILASDRAIDGLLLELARGDASRFGDLTVDESILSLAPYSIPLEDVLDSRAPRPHANTAVFFEGGPDRDRMRTVISRDRLDRFYRFEGTSIVLATDHLLQGVPGLVPIPAPG